MFPKRKIFAGRVYSLAVDNLSKDYAIVYAKEYRQMGLMSRIYGLFFQYGGKWAVYIREKE